LAINIYTGIKQLILTEEQLANYYENKSLDKSIYEDENLYNNQYVLITYMKDENAKRFQDKYELLDVKKWNGNKLVKLKKTTVNNDYIKVRSLNLFQDCMVDVLSDDSITIKSFMGIPGGGKSYMSISYGLDRVLKGDFNKLVYVRNNVDIGDRNIGALPGDLEQKLDPINEVLSDVLNRDSVDRLKIDKKIETPYIGFTVGRTYDNSWIVVDDCQQLSKTHVYNLTTRLGHNSVLCFCGDLFQTYSQKYENNNSGISYLHEQLKGEKFFSCVHTKISERSETAQRCAELLFDGIKEN